MTEGPPRDDGATGAIGEAGPSSGTDRFGDEDLTAHVLATLREHCDTTGCGALLAGHDPIVIASADRVVRLHDGLVAP